ncbi:hypothetical protein NKJ55_34450 [Mesorhizobium sp. M0106]|uniref:hypothetical protein n=1 Tax=Mesorhizobium sp. M0106 TaxID=2956880 RepID=UPI0033376064
MFVPLPPEKGVPMRFRIAMEITKLQGQVPVELIIKGYRFSKYGAVAFILHDIGPRTVNRVLDPVVPSMGLDIPGVKYVDITAGFDLYNTIFSAKSIIAFSPLFRALVTQAHGFADEAFSFKQVHNTDADPRTMLLMRPRHARLVECTTKTNGE